MTNNWINELSLDDDLQIDLLVDNELNEPQRQRLLVFFDSEPQYWRTLALRFVESQMIGETGDQPSAATADVKVAAATGHQSGTSSRRYWNTAVVCLGLCLAFMVGFSFDGFRNGPGRDVVKDVVKTDVPKIETGNTETNKTTPKENSQPSNTNNVAVDSPNPKQAPSLDQSAVKTNSPKLPRRAIAAVARNHFPVPMSRVRTANGKEAWKPRRPLSKSDELALRQSGFEVQRRIGFKRVRVGGSRLVVMPSQEVHIVRRSRHRI